MNTLITYALRERIRRKEFFIPVVLGLLLLLFLQSENATITVDGQPITGFESMLPVILLVMNGVLCILAAALSAGTIPEAYRSRTSHLIWVRGISQPKYHFSLAVANFLAVSAAGASLFFALGLVVLTKNGTAGLAGLFPAFLLLCVNAGIVTAATSVLSIVLPPPGAGVAGFLLAAAGLLHSMLRLFGLMTGGLAAFATRIVLRITPNLDALRLAAVDLLQSKTFDPHTVFSALLWLYGICLLFYVVRKKEA